MLSASIGLMCTCDEDPVPSKAAPARGSSASSVKNRIDTAVKVARETHEGKMVTLRKFYINPRADKRKKVLELTGIIGVNTDTVEKIAKSVPPLTGIDAEAAVAKAEAAVTKAKDGLAELNTYIGASNTSAATAPPPSSSSSETTAANNANKQKASNAIDAAVNQVSIGIGRVKKLISGNPQIYPELQKTLFNNTIDIIKDEYNNKTRVIDQLETLNSIVEHEIIKKILNDTISVWKIAYTYDPNNTSEMEKAAINVNILAGNVSDELDRLEKAIAKIKTKPSTGSTTTAPLPPSSSSSSSSSSSLSPDQTHKLTKDLETISSTLKILKKHKTFIGKGVMLGLNEAVNINNLTNYIKITIDEADVILKKNTPTDADLGKASTLILSAQEAFNQILTDLKIPPTEIKPVELISIPSSSGGRRTRRKRKGSKKRTRRARRRHR